MLQKDERRHMEKHKILVQAKNNHVSKCSIDKKKGVEKTLIYWQEEFIQKLEHGKNIYEIINENEIEHAALSKDVLVALRIYDTHGKKLNLGEITWRGWQKDLRKYLDEKM